MKIYKMDTSSRLNDGVTGRATCQWIPEFANPGLRKLLTAFASLAMINPTNTITSMALFMTGYLKLVDAIVNRDCS